jgi:hypothetical protein
MVKTRATACTGKKAHATRKQAQAHLDRLIRKGASPEVWAVYRCKTDPAHWHVGHRMPKDR